MGDDTTPPSPSRPRRRRTPIIGPLFSWDLVRLARRGQDARSRTILALVLLATLIVFTVVWFRTTDLESLFFGAQEVLDVKESARFAEQFALALLLAQMAVMVLLTPAYAAGSIADEKERRTWQYLLATDLSDREIVLGKFFGRVVFLLGVLMAGLPVLALTGLVGGIDPLFLGFGYIFTTSTVILLAAAGITAAIHKSTFRAAMFYSYGFTALYVFFGCGLHPLLSPFAVLPMLYTQRTELPRFLFLGFGYIAIQLAIAITLLVIAIRRIRRVERRVPQRRFEPVVNARRTRLPISKPLRDDLDVVPMSARQVDEDKWGEREDILSLRRPHVSPTWDDKPRVDDDDPFTWKEKYTLGTKRTADDESIQSLKIVVGVLVAVCLAFIVFISVMYTLSHPQTGVATLSKLLIFAGMAAIFTHLLTLAPAACGAVLRERNQLTLESLLMIPVPRRAILWPKWKVNLHRGWWWYGPGIVCVALGFFASETPAVALPMAVYLLAIVMFSVSLGLWLSCRCSTVVRAMMFDLCAVGALALVPLVMFWQFGERGNVLAAVVTAVLALLVLLLAVWFWKLALNRFEHYGQE